MQLVAVGTEEVLHGEADVVFAGHLVVETCGDVDHEFGELFSVNRGVTRRACGADGVAGEVGGAVEVLGVESEVVEVGFDTGGEASASPVNAESVVDVDCGVVVVTDGLGVEGETDAAVEEVDGHVESEEVVDGSATGFGTRDGGLEVEAEPLVVVEEGEGDGSGTASVGGVVAEAVEHEMGVLTLILRGGNGGK